MAEELRFMPLGLVRLKTFRPAHGLVRCNINTGVHAHAGGVDVSLRDVTIAHIGRGVTECGWRHTPEERGGFGEILKKSVSWERDTERDGRLSLSRGGLALVPHVFWGWGDEKNSIERLCLSPYVEEPLNSKVIKCFVPEQRSRQVFFEFRDSYVLCIYVMNAPCTFCTFIYMAMVQNEVSE